MDYGQNHRRKVQGPRFKGRLRSNWVIGLLGYLRLLSYWVNKSLRQLGIAECGINRILKLLILGFAYLVTCPVAFGIGPMSSKDCTISKKSFIW